MQYIVAAYTDTGIEKKTNQDCLCIRRAELQEYGEVLMAVICDGMGGLERGEVASATCVSAFGDWFDSYMNTLPIVCQRGFDSIREQWSELIDTIHSNLLSYASQHNLQLGTTVTGIITFGDRYLTVNVGDSRAYEIKKTLRQLTRDQSLVAQEIAAGRITEDEARHHPQRNILLQCLGAGQTVIPDFTEGKVQNDSLYLLCTDGLVHELSCDELAVIMQPTYLNSKEAMTNALRQATEDCKCRGETDNITSILVRASESRSEPKRKVGLRGLLRREHTQNIIQAAPQISLLEKAQITHTHEIIGR